MAAKTSDTNLKNMLVTEGESICIYIRSDSKVHTHRNESRCSLRTENSSIRNTVRDYKNLR